MYNTIGQCEDCKESPRFLQFVSFDEVGIEQIALCAHGCDDMRSIAYLPEDMVDAAIENEMERLKQEEWSTQAELEQRLHLCERTLKHNQSGCMDDADWGRVIELSKRIEDETHQAIVQCEALPQSAASMQAWLLLKQQERFYKELGRYAVGQSM